MTQDDRIKRLEEEIAYLRKDMNALIKTVNTFEPETHTHLTFITDTKSCTECKNYSQTNLEDLFN